MEKKSNRTQTHKTVKRLRRPTIPEDLRKDLSIAYKIQAAMIPERVPAVEGLEIAPLYLPSRAVKGDLFDIIHLTEDILALFMFDVAGHGVCAALVAAMAKVLFCDHIRALTSPKAVIERVNTQMIKSLSGDFHLTAIAAYLDLHDNKLVYCIAGHAYPIIYRTREKKLDRLPSTGALVGVSPNVIYDEKNVYLNPGDWLFFFTNGIYHLFKADSELFNRILFEKEIAAVAERCSPREFVDSLRNRYNPDSNPDDDIAAIVIEFLTESRKNLIKEKLGFNQNDPVYLQFISYFEEMDRSAAVILSSMDSMGYPDESIRKMKIILTELLANAIYHGNKEDHSKKVTMGHTIDTKKTVISILDEGDGFDPNRIPDPTLPENIIKDRGRGLYIVGQYVDNMEFNEKGNRVTVTKNNSTK